MNRQQRRATERASRQRPRSAANSRQGPRSWNPLAPLERLTLSRPYTESELLSDHIAIQMAANSLMDNTCTEDDFNRLATAFNLTTLVACEGNTHLHSITQPVLQALISVKKRYEKWGKWDLTQHEKEQLQHPAAS